MKPTPNPNWPRLSVDLPYVGGFHVCGHCQRCNEQLPMGKTLSTWEECDHNDKREGRFIRLCGTCANKIVGPHPRLYHRMQDNAPMPGAMPTCADCQLRDGLRCTSPLLKRNGGAGLPLQLTKPAQCMVDGRDYRGPMTLYFGPVTCEAKEPCAT